MMTTLYSIYSTVGLKRELYILSDNQVGRKSRRYLSGKKTWRVCLCFKPSIINSCRIRGTMQEHTRLSQLD